MSGSSYSSGIMTNKGKRLSYEQMKEMMDSKIISLNIQALPLIHNKGVHNFFKYCCKIIQLLFFHPRICSITTSHFAIELVLENDYNIIIEFGQYLTEISEKNEKEKSFDSFKNSLDSFINCREETIDLSYYYINDDGVRLTILNKNVFKKYEEIIKKFYSLDKLNSQEKKAEISFIITVYQQYFFSTIFKLLTSIKGNNNNPRLSSEVDYNIIECEIQNKISLEELCYSFKGKEWKANQYNVVTHNCQHFAGEVIKILKATRKNERDKIRSREKFILPNCIISPLWDNEKLSCINSLGRIPLFGPLYDIFAFCCVKEK